MTPGGVTAAVFGATGMVGIEVLYACLDEPRVSRVVTVGRRQTRVAHEKIREVIVADLADLAPAADALREVDLIVRLPRRPLETAG